MKRVVASVAFLVFSLFAMSFTTNENEPEKKANKIEIPSNVSEIIDNKCYGCHNSESKNKKGKKKLSFDKLNDLSTYKQIGKLESVHETIVEGEMPPSKFLDKYPNKALTAAEKETLISWAKEQGELLAK